MALINERLVFEGDSFDGVRVLRIGEAEVEVEVHGTRRVLRFSPPPRVASAASIRGWLPST